MYRVSRSRMKARRAMSRLSALSGVGELPPIAVRHAEARDLVGRRKVALLEVAVEGRRLRHVDRMHRHIVQRVDARALEAHHHALHALLVQREVARLDREHVVR